MHADNAATPNSVLLQEPAQDAGFASLVQGATREFQATLQLLAERARFLTGAEGAAIAIRQGGKFTYCAASGIPGSEVDGDVDQARDAIRECIDKVQPACKLSGQSGSSLAVPIFRNSLLVGVFELVSDCGVFEERDRQEVIRLAGLAGAAIELREAAEQAQNRMRESPGEGPAEATGHAPELPATEPDFAQAASSPAPLPNIDACSRCGFPISVGRKHCIGCEKKIGPSRDSEVMLFHLENEESWISAYGYTIASVLVTALAVAVVYWLR